MAIYPALEYDTDVSITGAQHDVLVGDNVGVSYDDLDEHLADAANQYFKEKGFDCTKIAVPDYGLAKAMNIAKHWGDRSACKKLGL